MERPFNEHALVEGDRLQSKHKVHITGEGYKKEVAKVEGYEDDTAYNIKKQIAQPATLQITSIILDNLNRWTSAQGTVKKIDFQDEQKNKEFRAVLSKLWRGGSFEKFINTFYRDSLYTEFNGFILVTKPKVVDANWIIKDGVITKRETEALDPYLIFIANSDIHDYLLTGDKVEYVIIKLDEKDHYRLIDDEKDIIFKFEKGKEKAQNPIPGPGDENYLVNELGYVPCRKISGINKSILSDQVKTSPIDHVVPALDRYFSSDADLRMQFIRHNYPKLAIVTKECTECHGSGKVYPTNMTEDIDMETQVTCTKCQGSGSIVPISRGGVIGLPQYLSQGDTAYPGTPASYITPDTDSLRLGLEDLLEQRQNIIYSATGDKNLVSESLNTATENLINSRSLEDRIRDITLMIEDFEKFIITAVKEMHVDFMNSSKFSVSIRYGKRISTKSEDELLSEMRLSKDAGMPSSYIAALHKDLLYAKYKNNNDELQKQLLLADLEPLAGYTVDDLDKVKDYINPDDMWLKINFDSIIAEIDTETPLQYFMPEADYRAKLVALNKKIDEILQKRIGSRGGNTGQNVAPAAPTATQNSGAGTGS